MLVEMPYALFVVSNFLKVSVPDPQGKGITVCFVLVDFSRFVLSSLLLLISFKKSGFVVCVGEELSLGGMGINRGIFFSPCYFYVLFPSKNHWGWWVMALVFFDF